MHNAVIDTSKLLGFDMSGAPLFDVVVPASSNSAGTRVVGAQKGGIVKSNRFDVSSISGDAKIGSS